MTQMFYLKTDEGKKNMSRFKCFDFMYNLVISKETALYIYIIKNIFSSKFVNTLSNIWEGNLLQPQSPVINRLTKYEAYLISLQMKFPDGYFVDLLITTS